MKTRWIISLVLATAFCAGIAFWWWYNPPYIVEIRHVALNGAVTYEMQRYEDWNHVANIRGLRKHTRDRIYHSIYADGLQYCFSKSGHVYAMVGTEFGLPSLFDREWNWSGEPHDFPYFDYSKTSPHVGP
ncbi:hypothetical protein [Prosthecobacter sp.]|uniref:hypothetical protein n=1 Tax=Prosthecobacter sp. TaxID=1965333 RepID=UPI003783CF8D